MKKMVGAQRTAHGGWFQSIHPGQGGDHPSGLGLAADRERKQDALETPSLHRTTVRSHQRGLADADLGVHDLLLETRIHMPGGGGPGLSLKRISTSTSMPIALR